VQGTQAQWADAYPTNGLRGLQVQPFGRVGFGGVRAAGQHQADAAGQPPGGERQRRLAGHVQPLDVVDGQQDRLPGCHRRDDRRHRRPGDALIGGRPVGARAQKHPVDGHALQLGQTGQHLGLDVLQQVGHRGVGQNRLGFVRPSRQHSEPEFPGPLHPVEPQCRLADSRLPRDHQGRRRHAGGAKQVVDRLALFRATHRCHWHVPIIAASKGNCAD
jgi:hypothetical protein